MAGMNDAASVDSGPTAAFRAARDLLLAHRTDYATARAEFSWPELDEFNWALDWFDVIAAEHPQRTALRVVWDNGTDESVSFGEMATRSSQVATWLRGLGVRRGDHILLMLGNVVPLWETCSPRSSSARWSSPRPRCCSPRTSPTGSSAAMCGTWSPTPADAAKFADIPGDWTRDRRRRGARLGPLRRRHATRPPAFTPDGVTRASDPLLLYFTSGTTSQPKLVGCTRHASYPVGHLSTMYWIGLQPGDVHLNISLARLGQARVEQLLRPVERAGPRSSSYN